jgi:hypothetical protein
MQPWAACRAPSAEQIAAGDFDLCGYGIGGGNNPAWVLRRDQAADIKGWDIDPEIWAAIKDKATDYRDRIIAAACDCAPDCFVF